MLYTLNKPSTTTNSFDSLLGIAPKGTPILLYEDGVYIAISGARDMHKVVAALADHSIYALDADCEARGIKNIIPGITIISYDGFVELVENHDVVPWL
jgi:tRNA 2-thiouridine synthesizing protein B